MARSIFASFLLFVVLLVGLTSSNAQGTGTGVAVNGSAIVQLNVTGGLFCNLLGDPLGNPLVGVNVTLSCDGGRSTIAETVTNINGLFQLIFNASNFNPFYMAGCRVFVPLPVNANCTILPTAGSLQAGLTLLGITTTGVNAVVVVVVNFVMGLPLVFFP